LFYDWPLAGSPGEKSAFPTDSSPLDRMHWVVYLSQAESIGKEKLMMALGFEELFDHVESTPPSKNFHGFSVGREK